MVEVTTRTGLGLEAALNIATRQANQTNTNGRVNREDFVKSEFWLNLGITFEWDEVDEATGEKMAHSQLITIPFGVSLDAQKLQPVTSTNVEFARMNAGKNHLINSLRELAATLKPGERVMTNLEVQLARINGENAEAANVKENPFVQPLQLIRCKVDSAMPDDKA